MLLRHSEQKTGLCFEVVKRAPLTSGVLDPVGALDKLKILDPRTSLKYW